MSKPGGTAHAAGARVVLGKDFDHRQLGNATAEGLFAAGLASEMLALYTDGVNLDVEGLTSGAPALTQFTSIVAAALRAANPSAQLSFDTSIYPTAVAGGYDLVSLAAICDFLVPMAYDMDWAASPARANSPLPLVTEGVVGYTATLAIDPFKVVLALPWYGYNFPCNSPFPSGGGSSSPSPCHSTGFSGSWSRSYSEILTSLLPRAGSAGVQRDSASSSVWIDYTDSAGVWNQVWFDDDISLRAKYALSTQYGLRGVAVWTADFVNASTPAGQAMWAALSSVSAASFSPSPSPASLTASPNRSPSRSTSARRTAGRTNSSSRSNTPSASATHSSHRTQTRTRSAQRSQSSTRSATGSGSVTRSVARSRTGSRSVSSSRKQKRRR